MSDIVNDNEHDDSKNFNIKDKEIEYHTQDKRKHYRITIPIWVKVDDKTYKTEDWSIGGLSLVNFHKTLNVGDELELKVLIKFQGFNIGFDAKVKIISAHNNKIRCKFVDLSSRSKNILQFFSQSIISGQMVDIEDAIKRIDIPINLQDDNLEEYKNEKRPFFRWPLKTIFFTIFYLTAGLLLFLYVALILYSNFVHMKVDSAIVTAPTEAVVSPFEGVIEKIYVTKDQTVRANEPMLTIKDHLLEQNLELERANHEQVKADLEVKAKNFREEKSELGIYKTIGQTRVEEAKQNLQSLIETNENLASQHERAKKLYAKRYIALSEYNKFEADHEASVHKVEQARHQYQEQLQALKSIDTGHYYSRDQVQSAVPQQEALVAQAEKNIAASQQKITAMEKQLEAHTLRVPFDGDVVDISKSTGNTVARGDKLMLIEHNQPRTITAYLTQDEVVELEMGGTATIYVPSLKKRFAGKILQIDRTYGFVDEVNTQYKPRTTNDRSANVIIVLTDFSIEDTRKFLAPGTPAVVYFNRSLSEGVWHRLQLYFSPSHTPNKIKNTKATTAPSTSMRQNDVNSKINNDSKTTGNINQDINQDINNIPTNTVKSLDKPTHKKSSSK